MKNLEAIIFDWAGTTVDFGCFAPVQAFIEIFNKRGIEVTIDEARLPMGLPKWEHIKAMLSMPRINALWNTLYNRSFENEDIDLLFQDFEPLLLSSLKNYSTPIPGVVEVIDILKSNHLKIGSTTGYTRKMIEIVKKEAEILGYRPDYCVTTDETQGIGRPYPYMIFENMKALHIKQVNHVVKVGDTLVDIEEGLSAGVWTIGIIIGSSELGLTFEEFDTLSSNDKILAKEKVRSSFNRAGADFVIDSIYELPELLQKIDEKIS